jgi:hypothetical protein
MPTTARLLLDSYNTFLDRLDQESVRTKLENLSPEDAANDTEFQALQETADQFEQGLEQLFFDDPRWMPLTRRYGVF